MTSMRDTLATRLWPAAADSLGAKIALVLAGTALLTLSAKVQIPFWPVPMTMQTFVVLLIGAAYGARLGGATLLAYLAQGAVGLPVFAAGGGLAYLTGPTAGYLFGFLAAAVLVGWLAERGLCGSRLGTLATFLAGTVVMFGLGAGWLGALFGAEVALASGVVPFLLSEAVKIALAVALVPLAWKRLGRG
jgi:biotin transport system substrate-specific component